MFLTDKEKDVKTTHFEQKQIKKRWRKLKQGVFTKEKKM